MLAKAKMKLDDIHHYEINEAFASVPLAWQKELKADGDPYRAFVCHTINPWGFPAKDRSGRLDQVEEPHLGRLMTKIRAPVAPAPKRLTYTPPPADPAADAQSQPQS